MLGSGDSLYDIGLDSGADLFDWCKVWLKVDVVLQENGLGVNETICLMVFYKKGLEWLSGFQTCLVVTACSMM